MHQDGEFRVIRPKDNIFRRFRNRSQDEQQRSRLRDQQFKKLEQTVLMSKLQ